MFDIFFYKKQYFNQKNRQQYSQNSFAKIFTKIITSVPDQLHYRLCAEAENAGDNVRADGQRFEVEVNESWQRPIKMKISSCKLSIVFQMT
jgi:hypothetical protein